MTYSATSLESLLHRSHARVYRIAAALCVTRADAEDVVEKVLLRSGPISARWTNDVEAQRWLVHYTVLTSRSSTPAPPEQDVLWNTATTAESAAIIAAIRQLPMQQREAFLLHHGEKLELRQLATAMDCSSAAAGNHLSAAASTLRLLTADGLDDFTEQLPALMAKLVPADEVLELQIRQFLARRRKWIWARRILKALRWALLAIIIATVSWIAGRIIHDSIS